MVHWPMEQGMNLTSLRVCKGGKLLYTGPAGGKWFTGPWNKV